MKVRLFRPFSIKHFVDVLPETVKKIAVMDRTKEPGSIGEPLYQDVVSALYEAGKTGITVVGGRYGLGSKDTPPSSAFAIYEELKKDAPAREFTIGIVDDVTGLSLPEMEDAPNTAAEGTIECKFWGLGGDGTVGANKNSTKIIGDHTDKYIQSYFQYDSKKTGGVTISHVRFGDHPIRSPYYITKADFVACHNPSYITKHYKIAQGCQARRYAADQLPVGCRGARPSSVRRGEALHRQERCPALHHRRYRPGRSGRQWASAPTPCCSPRSSRWPRCSPPRTPSST